MVVIMRSSSSLLILSSPTVGVHDHNACPQTHQTCSHFEQMFMNMPVPFRCHHTGTCIQDPTEVTGSGFSPLLFLFSNEYISWAALKMSPNHGIPSNIRHGHATEHSLIILKAAIFSIHNHKAIAHTKTSGFKTASNNLFVRRPTLFITTTLAHTFRTPSKVAGSGSIPFCCICLNNSNAFCHSPYLTSHKIMAFPAIISCTGTSEGTLSKHPLRSTPLSYKFTRLSAQGHQTDNHLGESNHHLHHEQQWLIAIIPH